ncbi:MAG: Cache 3/Cache 2 fusion domain-containing protein [Rhodomicrobium sp.]
MKRSLITTVILSGAFVALASSIYAENAPVIGKKGTSPYVTHFIFRPLQSLEVKGVGTATLLEAVGTTQNLKGEPMLDKMAARCTALNVESGDKKYIDGACALTDKDGDVIFSTFDTRDLDASQPDMKCGTHIITGGSGKYAGITGREPFACNDMPKLAGTGGYFAMDIPHNTTWEIKSSAMDDPAQKVKSSMALLRSEAAKLGAAKVEGTDRVAGQEVPGLYFGSTKMNNNFELVDDVVAKMGGTATFFVNHGEDFIRVATNVKKDDGSRAVGTILDPKGKVIVNIRNNEPYYGEATILGKNYQTGYEPIRDGANKIVGIYYVGYLKE